MMVLIKKFIQYCTKLWKNNEQPKKANLSSYSFAISPIVYLSRDDLLSIQGFEDLQWRAVAIFYDYFAKSFVIFLANNKIANLPRSVFNDPDQIRIDPLKLEIIQQGLLIRVGQKLWISTRRLLEMIEDEKIRKGTKVSDQVATD